MTAPRPALFDARRQAYFLQLVGNGTPAHQAARICTVPYQTIEGCITRDPGFAARFAEALSVARVEAIENALWQAATEPRGNARISVRAAIALCETYLPERWIDARTQAAMIKAAGPNAVIDYLNAHDPMRHRHHQREKTTGIAVPADPAEVRRRVHQLIDDAKRQTADVNSG